MKYNAVVRVENLKKLYGSTVAVSDISFEVNEGEIFGIVGPNGAGKTTTIECVEGLRRPTGGNIEVFGLKPLQDGYVLKQRIGIQLQESSLPPRIKTWEALDLFSSFYSRSTDWHDLVDRLGLDNFLDTPFAKLSGGQKRRLFIGLALINDPDLIFFDELTTGLDPQARHSMWDMLKEINTDGKTIFLTTHFMEEAERLCNRVAIIDMGRIVALDSPENLIRNLNIESRIIFTLNGYHKTIGSDLKNLNAVTRVESIGDRVIVYGSGTTLISDVVNLLTSKGISYSNFRTEQPNLEDVFLTLTGKKMRD